LARPRRGRIGVSDRWDDNGGIARDDYLIATELAVQKSRGWPSRSSGPRPITLVQLAYGANQCAPNGA
jgi:hypothetical protein